MGRAKKAFLLLLFLIAVISVPFLRYYASYHSENLDIFAESISQPSGILSSKIVLDDLAVFSTSWDLIFRLSVSNRNPADCRMEEAAYVIYLGDTQLLEGQFQNIHLPKYATTPLPDIPITLSMEEIAESNPQLIANALQNNGKLNFKISITLRTPALLFGLLRIGTAQTSKDLWVSVHVVDSISVSSFHWKSERYFVKECHPGEELVGQFRISKRGETVGGLEAKITEITLDGRETVLTLQELEGDPVSRYGTFNVSWCVPDSPPVDCIGFSIHLIYGGIEVWSAPIYPPSLQLVRKYTLSEALSGDEIHTTLRGRGYCAGDAVKIEVEIDLEVSVDLEIEAGTVLINMGAGQNMIIGETRVVRVEPLLKVELNIEAYCLDLHKDNPNASEVFNVAQVSGGYGDDTVRLMQSLKDAPWEYKSISGVQLALWVIVENPPRSEVERIFTVTESSLEDAAWLLQNIGIDPNQKKLFSGS